jgi:AraC-like DNA-binding protein
VGFSLSHRMLDLPLKTSDPRAFRLADAMCERELLRLHAGRSWVARVQRILHETRVGFPSLHQTARQLHVTPRTLHRRLTAEGTSFRAVLDDVRHRAAVEQLRSGEATIQEVAYLLGYSDPANFRRAFRRWTGSPPSAYCAVKA